MSTSSQTTLVVTAVFLGLVFAGCPAFESESAKRPVYSVPDVVGVTLPEAEQAIKDAKLSIGAVVQASSTGVLAGIVISQEPEAGTDVFSKTTVDLVVSTGSETPAQVAVPDLVDLPQGKAERTLAAAGLSLGAVHSAYSATIRKGRVAAHDPAAGTSVAVGTAVVLYISIGAKDVSVPDVTGLTQAEAEAMIVSTGLSVGTVAEAYHETIPAGIVSGQEPTAGTVVSGGSAVDLMVSKGHAPVFVPDLAGMTQSEAETALDVRGLNVGVVKTFYVATAPAGFVYSQLPVAGSEAEWGSDVKLWVSLGTPGQSWTRLYGTDGDENVGSIARPASCAMATSDGAVLIASRSVDAAGNSSTYLVKVGSDGAIMPSANSESGLFEFILGWPDAHASPYAMCKRGDGTYAVATYYEDTIAGTHGVLLWFVHESGDTTGFAFYPDAGRPGSVFAKPDGGLVIAADVVIETDAFDNEVARHEFATPVFNCFGTTDGGFVTLRVRESLGSLVAKYNAQWEPIWEGFYADGSYNLFNDMVPAPDGGVYVGGWGNFNINSPDFGNWHVALLDVSGNTVWAAKTYMGRIGVQRLYATADGGVLALGHVDSRNNYRDDYDLQCAKIDAAGVVEHDWTVGGGYRDWPGDVLEMQDGSYIITGHYQLGYRGPYDVYVTKIAPNTPAPWTRTWGPGEFSYSALLADDGGAFGIGLQYDPDLSERGLYVKVDHAGNEAWRKVLGDERWANITFSIGRSTIGSVGSMDLKLLGIGRPPGTESGSDLFLEAINDEGETLFTREFHTSSVAFAPWLGTYTVGFIPGRPEILIVDGGVASDSSQDISFFVLNLQGEIILEKTHNAGVTWETDAFCIPRYGIRQGLFLLWSVPDPANTNLVNYKLIEKLDADLNRQWQYIPDGVASRIPWLNLYELDDGGVLLNVGARELNPDTGFDEQSFHLVKLDDTGHEAWRKAIGQEALYSNVDVFTRPGDIYVGETRISEPGTDYPLTNFILTALTFNGEERWSRTFNNAYSARVLFSDNGDCLLSYREYRERVSGEGYYTFFRKLDAHGADVWSHERLHDLAGTIVAAKDGGYLLYGHSEKVPTGQGSSSAMLTKTDAEGNVAWSSHFGKGQWNHHLRTHETEDGGYLCTTQTTIASGFGTESVSRVVWYKLDSQGRVLGQPQD
jgi:beta-lactam-binding protein with PASTA domain